MHTVRWEFQLFQANNIILVAFFLYLIYNNFVFFNFTIIIFFAYMSVSQREKEIKLWLSKCENKKICVLEKSPLSKTKPNI